MVSKRLLLALAGGIVLGCGFLAGCGGRKGRLVLLVSIDTLRADHMSVYGYPRSTTPGLERMSREGVVFEACHAPAPYTLPSHMSLMTSLYPEAHGILLETDGPLSPRVPTLAEILRGQGYATAGFVDGGMVRGEFGFHRGFDLYDDARTTEGRNGMSRYLPRLRDWVAEHRRRDMFLFLHTFDVHGPYRCPEEFQSVFRGHPAGRALPRQSLARAVRLTRHDYLDLGRFADLQEVVDAYDGCIGFVDHMLDTLFESLRELDLWEDALVIVTSDHGEMFLEHGMIGHSYYLTRELIRVPLIIKFPGRAEAGRRCGAVVELVDVMPTILQAAGIAVPSGLHGQDLKGGLIEGRWSKDHAFGISPKGGGHHFLVEDGFKYIEATPPDPGFLRSRRFFSPHMPRALDPGSTLYLRKEEREARRSYNFEEDPLRIQSFIHYQDRLYRWTGTSSERSASVVDDPGRRERFRKRIRSLVAEARSRFRAIDAGGAKQSPLDDLTRAELVALGYVEIAPETDGRGETASRRGRAVPAVTGSGWEVPPRKDLALLEDLDLYRADQVLWRLHRARLGTVRIPEEEVPALRQMAEELYLRYEERDPGSEPDLGWRRKSLEVLASRLGQD